MCQGLLTKAILLRIVLLIALAPTPFLDWHHSARRRMRSRPLWRCYRRCCPALSVFFFFRSRFEVLELVLGKVKCVWKDCFSSRSGDFKVMEVKYPSPPFLFLRFSAA